MQTLCHLMPLVNTIYQISKKYDKHYCYPSQKTLQAILSEKYGIKRSIATINRWLRIIEDLGYVDRVRRIRKYRDGTYSFKSTMYFLKIKGLKKLNQLSYDVFEALKKYYAKFVPKNADKKNTSDPDKKYSKTVRPGDKNHDAVREKIHTSSQFGLKLNTL